MLQYYTLEEAANLLGMHPDGAKKLLDDRKVRQYRDGRGKVRYVASAVDELVRTLGGGSDPELPLGEAQRAKRAGNTPRPTKAQGDAGSTSNFDLGPADSADVPIGHEPLDASGSASKRSGRSPRPAGSKSPSPRSPAPKSGSDSDVRLVADASDLEFQIAADSDVKMVDEGSSPSRSGVSGPKSGIGSKSGVRKGPGESHDSEVRIVPMMDVPSDSDVRIADEEQGSVELGHPPAKKHSDSDIRLEEASAHPPRADEGSDDAHVTEEIDLDAEARKHAEAQKAKGKSKMKRADKPAGSPFELSDDSVEKQLPKSGKKKPDSSSDFELTPAADSDDSVELSSGELAAMAAADADSSEEEVNLGEVSGGAGTSGINLDAPADSGISLEGTGEGHDEMEFELSLDSGSTPKPGPKSGKQKKATQEDSSSEFELSLDSDSSDEQPKLQKAAKGPAEEDSDSEFELTLDDSGGLVPLEGEKAAESSQGEGDIFETDFEVPALDEESGSEAVALDESDTDLESSDFDLALEEGDAAGGEESGSQVVALEDEEDVDAAAETVQRPKKKAARRQAAAAPAASAEGEALEELADVDDEAAVSEESVEEAPARGRAAPAVVAAAPAEWGAMPGVVMMICVVFMVLATLMGFELVNNMVGYQQPGKVSGFLTESLAKTFDMDLPKD